MQDQQKASNQKICVVVRKRPLNKKQSSRNETDVVDVKDKSRICVRQHKLKVDLTKYIETHEFNFDSAYDQNCNNEELYCDCVRPIIQCAFLGAKVTCFAYGQTGSGKTYTMNGDIQNGCPGMYYLGAEDIFALRDSKYQDLQIAVSFYQIYCGKLFDLLNGRQQLQAREDAKQNVNIVGLTVKNINKIQEFMQTILYGSSIRITSQNSTNADSSRSHAILQISLLAGKKVHGKISFIDLAGCERGADTIQQNKQTKIDGAQINKSLLALKQCIRALDQGKNHTPFRGSKLTMVLKDSFTGFCRTLMIGNISPNSGSCQNTLNTLRYADRVKQLKKNSQTDLTKQDQMARQLMLPRTHKNKQILIKNDSDQEQQLTPIINNSLLIKQKIPSTSSLIKQNLPQKIPGKSSKVTIKNQQSDGIFKKKNTNKPNGALNRKGILNNNNQIENLQKSVNHYDIRSQILKNNNSNNNNRNKSVLGKQLNKQLKNLQVFEQQLTKKNTNNSNIYPNTTQIKGIEVGLNNYRSRNINSNNNNININGNNSNMSNSYLNNYNHTKFQKKTQNVYKNYPPLIPLGDQQILQQSDYKQWNNILDKFRLWVPDPNYLQEMSAFFQQLVKFIMREELQISQLHKHTLIKQSSSYRQYLNMYNETQNDNKNNQEMYDYAERLSTFLTERSNSLLKFREKVELYKYHLKEHQMCEAKLIEAGEMINSENIWDNNHVLESQIHN